MRDASGNLLADRAVELVVIGSGNVISPTNPTVTDAAGQVSFTLASSRAEAKSLSLRDVYSGVTLPAGTVIFVPGLVDTLTCPASRPYSW